MAAGSDDSTLNSLLAAVNVVVKTDIKNAEDTLKMRRIVGNVENESKDNHECVAVLDSSLLSAAFKYYRNQNKENNTHLDISSSSNKIWVNSYAIINETNDSTQPLDSTNDLEKTLSELQMDADLISEWPIFNTDFLNLYNFFDEQIESSIDSLSNQSAVCESKMNENEVLNPNVHFEIGNSDLKENSKSLCNESPESVLPESENESYETRSAVSKSSLSPSQHSGNAGERPVPKPFHIEDYFPEELDYEPSDIGETEAKESDNEFCNGNSFEGKENGSFMHYCSHVEVPANSSFQNIDMPKENTEKPDLLSFFENNFEQQSSKSRLQDNYERCLEYEEDDSESDSEHSFKRNSSKNKQVNKLETLQQPIINPDVSKISQLDSINEVMLYINEQCQSGNINEAIAVSSRYIAISLEAVQLEIFKELFLSIIDLIKSSVLPVDDVRVSMSLREVMNLFHQSKLFNANLCSLIINECLYCKHAIETGKRLFSFIQEIKVPVNSKAISSYLNIMMPSEIHSLELITLMEYVKYVCKLPCPKPLLREALMRLLEQEEDSLPILFSRLCKLLCSVNSNEVDFKHLQNFIQFCIRNDNWTQISNFFQAWCNRDGHLISCLTRSFLFRPEDVGLFYEKLAEEIYNQGDASLYLVGILGQIGVSLMMEVFSRKQYQSAFGVLFTLHKRNINYLELQASLYHAPGYLKSLPNFTDLFVFPFTVAFAALDICLHLERFRDAYRIFKSFTLNLPIDMDEKFKLKIRSRKFGYLLRLAKDLYSIEPMKLGLQALHNIFSTAEDFSLEELEDFSEEIQVIYNKYLAYVINGCQLHTALEVFGYSEGVMKDIFIIHPQVLRGLLVTFAQNDKMDEAYKFFLLGCLKKVYIIEQIRSEELVCYLTILSTWTIFEVEFVIKTFIKNVSKAWEGKHKTNIDEPLSINIVFKKSEENCSELNCLKKSYSLDSAKEIACNVLQSLDSGIKWIVKQNSTCLELIFETVYNYWINNFRWRKDSRKNVLEDVSPNTEFQIQVSEEDFGFKYQTESNSVKASEKVLDRMTPDSSYQLISEEISHDSLTREEIPSESCQPVPPETTFSENSDLLFVSGSTEQEQIISSSNLLSPDIHNTPPTMPDNKTDAPENIPTGFCSGIESSNRAISEESVEEVSSKSKIVFKRPFKKTVSKTAKVRKSKKKVQMKKKPISKKEVILPPETEEILTETEDLMQESSEQTCSSKPSIIENFQITLKNSEKHGESRVVSHASEVKFEDPKNIASALNVPETVFLKIVLFIKSKVLLKCKDLQPQQQQEKANHLASQFIQSNVVSILDKRTMKLLSEFADGSI